jgi:cell division protein FtsB
MRKALIILAVAIAAGYFLYNMMDESHSEQEGLVDGVRARYVEAVNKFLQAVRYGAGLGMDNSMDVEQASNEVLKVRAELAKLRPELTEAKAIASAEKLADKIEEFCRKNDII